jgi:ATP-dependent exoDNAse (exonuclease V) beta subunit
LRLVVRNEFPFAYREGDCLMTGSIDRLVRLYAGDQLVAADVIDFKTDVIESRGPKTLDAKTEYYRPQIDAYRRAVAAMTGLAPERIGARLLFVNPGIVQEM